MKKAKSLFTDEEIVLLSEEEDLLSKKDAGEDLTDEEKDTLSKVAKIREDIPKRLKEAGTPNKVPDTKSDENKIVLQALSGYWRRQRKAAEKAKGEGDKPKPDKEKGKGDKKPAELSNEERDFLLTAGKNKKPRDKTEFGILRGIAKEQGISLAEAAESKEYKTFTNAHRSEKSEAKKIPEPSSRSSVLPKRLNPDEMTEEEHKEKFTEMKDEITKKQTGEETKI